MNPTCSNCKFKPKFVEPPEARYYLASGYCFGKCFANGEDHAEPILKIDDLFYGDSCSDGVVQIIDCPKFIEGEIK